ncbi:MAG: AAA family ATPase [Lachnospiraceae bacterium]|nr:AAA family ATPase [Lachnospiraceae bacterium]
MSGARQTGKTTEIFKFADKNYEQIIYVNLADKKQLESFESAVRNTSDLFGLIQYCRESDNAEFCNLDKTVLIIDEIQESSDIYNSIRA